MAACAVLCAETLRVGLDPDPGRRPGWRLFLRSRLDYTVLARSHHTAIRRHGPVGTDTFWILEQRQSSRWARQDGFWCHPEWGVFTYVGSWDLVSIPARAPDREPSAGQRGGVGL
jgi:hypothetical protein